MSKPTSKEFIPLNIVILTVSDTRTDENDTSGDLLRSNAEEVGHTVLEKVIVKDDIYQIRAQVSKWIASDDVQVILTTGGTGFTSRDSTPEALEPLFDKTIDGFGELFRYESLSEIGTSTIQSRALAGLANAKVIFCLPGSNNACQTAWNKIVGPQLDNRTRPCNFVPQVTAKH